MASQEHGQQPPTARQPTLWAVSDLHTGHVGNKPVTESLYPSTPDDWLIVCGDVAERTDEIRWALDLLRRRFAKVIWVPGNHELWTTNKDPMQVFGRDRYDYLVNICDELGVVSPEHPFPVWTERGGPATIVPLFLLYDYSFLPRGATTKAEGLAIARERNVVCTDEFLLSPRAVPDARGVVPRARGRDPQAARRPGLDESDRAGQPFPDGAPAVRRAVPAGVLAVVRNHRDRRLAHPLQRGVLGLRAPAHSADHLVRRRPLRRGVGGLSAGVAPPQAVQLAAPDAARPAVRARLSQRLRRTLRHHRRR